MDCKTTILLGLAALLTILVANTDGRNKKVVIHVPYKVKKLKHTHTVYKTIHHHHTYDHVPLPDEHEHFHHVYSHEDQPISLHSQPIPGIGIPDFLPDASIDHSYELSEVTSHEHRGIPNRHFPKYSPIPLYRRH